MSPAGEGWTKVTFTGVELAAAGVPGDAVTAANIVMDEQGQTLLRNISVNGVAISRYFQSD